jgi:hypothetical protein
MATDLSFRDGTPQGRLRRGRRMHYRRWCAVSFSVRTDRWTTTYMETTHSINKPDISSAERCLELLNRVGDLQLQYLKRLHNRASVLKRYLAFDPIHIHGIDHRSAPFCLIFNRVRNMQLRDAHLGEASVFAMVGKVSERLYPVASVARLQSPNHCDVFLAKEFQRSVAPSLKRLWFAVHGKIDLRLKAWNLESMRTRLDARNVMVVKESRSSN